MHGTAVSILTLGQRVGDRQSEIFLWLGVLTAAVVVLGVVLMVLRKWLHDTASLSHDMPFTLGDLRQMHREGKLTDDEFEKAKHQVIALSRGRDGDAASAAADKDGNLRTDSGDLADQTDREG